MTASVHDMRSEAARIGRAHPDVLSREQAIARHPATTSKCPPSAALLHRVASLITTENLPPARVTTTRDGQVIVELTGAELVESNVRRWAAALELVVTEAPFEVDSGLAATQWYAAGFDGHGAGVGAYWHVHGYELLPTAMVDRFGCGIGPAT